MPPTAPQSLRDQLLREAVEMIRYAFASGKSVPTSVVDAVEQYESHPPEGPPLAPAPLVLAHSRLARIVAPATPRAIVLLADGETAGRFAFLGPVVLVRQLMAVAIGCVVAFVLLGLFEATGSSTVSFVNTWGWNLLLNELWWLSAAGLGASFAILFQVNEYIRKSSYNPKYAPTYWVKFLLGVMAGYILVALLPFEVPRQGTAINLVQPALALLGGYSASAVYRILTRLVEAVEAIFRGNVKDLIAEREAAATARAFEEASRGRVRQAARLVDVLGQLAAGATADEVSATIREIVASLAPEVSEAEPLPATVSRAAPASVTVAATPQALVAAAGRAPREPAEEVALAG
ncbi:hypothetical protein [Longimicrobium sp.]|uniref:hypothetical protein n=1 Tax=Longimicrobium sp. TaxID=2029185 RepID=UPI002C57F035|nr:hypothetical protein [Longimicrobium sp.]HSU17220.1 hypothetical protein [Longimicrobium sp.]